MMTLWLVPGTSFADEPNAEQQADARVRAGAALGAEQRYDEAIAQFHEAERLFPRAIHDCNIGLAYRLSERWPQAFLYLRSCLARATSALPRWVDREHRAVQARLTRGAFTPVAIHVQPRGALVRFPDLLDDASFPAPVSAWLPRQSIRIEVEREGFQAQQRTLHPQGEASVRVDVSLEPLAASVEAVDADTAAEGESSAEELVTDTTAPEGPGSLLVVETPPEEPVTLQVALDPANENPSLVVPWVVVSSGLLLAGVGGVFHGLASGRRDRMSQLPAGAEFDEEMGAFEVDRGLAIGLYAAGAIVTGVGAYLLGRD